MFVSPMELQPNAQEAQPLTLSKVNLNLINMIGANALLVKRVNRV